MLLTKQFEIALKKISEPPSMHACIQKRNETRTIDTR